MFSTTHLHPMLVHFPIALVVVGFLAELAALYFKKEVCLTKLGFYLLLLGTLAAFAALLTGVLFTGEMTGAAGEIQEIHELFAWITLGTLTITSLLRLALQTKIKENKNFVKLAFVFYAVAAVSVSITGFYGGTLVFNYMMPI